MLTAFADQQRKRNLFFYPNDFYHGRDILLLYQSAVKHYLSFVFNASTARKSNTWKTCAKLCLMKRALTIAFWAVALALVMAFQLLRMFVGAIL